MSGNVQQLPSIQELVLVWGVSINFHMASPGTARYWYPRLENYDAHKSPFLRSTTLRRKVEGAWV